MLHGMSNVLPSRQSSPCHPFLHPLLHCPVTELQLRVFLQKSLHFLWHSIPKYPMSHAENNNIIFNNMHLQRQHNFT